jgi:thiamine biosynthesis lipoprotein
MSIKAQTVHERVRSSARVSTERQLNTLAFHAMGTLCRVSFAATTPGLIKDFISEVLNWVADFEARYSRFIPDSLIGSINQSAGKQWVEFDEEADRLFSLCQELWFYTRGAFDPTALPLIKLWNWKADPPVIPDDATVKRTLELVGWRKVQRRKGAIFLPQEGMSIDLGGIGKEYAVDMVLALALQRGIGNVLVDFGQDVRVHGMPPGKPAWHIGLEDPKKPGSCWAGVAVKDHAVASSGDYLRYFQKDGRRYGHILDPRNGYPVNNDCRAVTVIAPTCTVAGILSTTAFVLGPKEGLALIASHFGAEGAITTETSRVHTSRFHEYVAS